MRVKRYLTSLLIPTLIVSGCANLPGSGGQQGAVIGGAGGATAGAIIGRRSPLLGALIGGALGAGGGYLVGAHRDKTRDPDGHRDEAVRASRDAELRPARATDVMLESNSQSADLNNDGYVTMDEVVAMRQAGLADDEMLRRLRSTGQVFDLTKSQQDYLYDHGVSNRVIDGMLDIGNDDDRSRNATYRAADRDPGYQRVDGR